MLPLQNKTIVSLALNLPGPAALQRMQALGANCLKLEPPSGDPMAIYSKRAYDELHVGIAVRSCDLKTDAGQAELHAELAQSDMLLTSFRPQALDKLGLNWGALHARHPHLRLVSIVGGEGEQANASGHDLTYMAENELIQGLNVPATLFADMGGALLVTEAILASFLASEANCQQVSLSKAAHFLAGPRRWKLMHEKVLGGGIPIYCVYPCADGRVALAALEPHFQHNLLQAMGKTPADAASALSRAQLEAFFADQTRAQIDALAAQFDLPLCTMQADNHAN